MPWGNGCVNLELEGKSLLPQKQGTDREGLSLRRLCPRRVCSSPSLRDTVSLTQNKRDFTDISYKEPERAISGVRRPGERSLLSQQRWSELLESQG